MSAVSKSDEKIANMSFALVYPNYLAKIEKHGRTKKELDQVIEWFTGFNEQKLQTLIDKEVPFSVFFQEATLKPTAHLIMGTICGYRLEAIKNPLTRKVRSLDKLVDDLAKGKTIESLVNRRTK